MGKGDAARLLDLDPREMCRSRLARLLLAHGLLEQRYTTSLWRRVPADLLESLEDIMELRLSPSYHETIRKTYVWENRSLVPYRCFTENDLRTQAEFLLAYNDIPSTVDLCLFLALMSSVCLITEISIRFFLRRIWLTVSPYVNVSEQDAGAESHTKRAVGALRPPGCDEVRLQSIPVSV